MTAASRSCSFGSPGVPPAGTLCSAGARLCLGNAGLSVGSAPGSIWVKGWVEAGSQQRPLGKRSGLNPPVCEEPSVSGAAEKEAVLGPGLECSRS